MARRNHLVLALPALLPFSLVWISPATAQAPTCSIAGPSVGVRGQVLCFTATASDPDEGAIVSYSWDFGGGNRSYGWWDMYEADAVPEDAGWERYEHQDPITDISEIDPPGIWHLVDFGDDKCKMGKYPDLSAGATVVGRYMYVSNSGTANCLAADIQTVLYRVRATWHANALYVDKAGTGTDQFYGSVPAGEWHVIRLTIDSGGNWALYLDEDPAALASGTGGPAGTPNRTTIGCNSTAQSGELYCDWLHIANSGAWAPGEPGGPVLPGSLEDNSECATWDTLGSMTVTLTVIDDQSEVGTCTHLVTVANALPSCSISFEPDLPGAGQTITCHANASDSDGTVASCAWDFGDGNTGSGDPTSHVYAVGGTYTVAATVTDNDGGVGSCSRTVDVNEPPVCVIDGPAIGVALEEVCFSGSDSYDPDGGVLTFAWDFGDGPPDIPLQDPSFETGAGWTTLWGGGEGMANSFDFCGFAARTGDKFFGNAVSYGLQQGVAKQQVGGLTPGETYSAEIWINSVSWDLDDPTSWNVHTRVGVDPLGGTGLWAHSAPSVVWSADTSNQNCGPGPYIKHSVTFEASQSVVTVFCMYWNDWWAEWSIMAMDDVALVGVRGTASEEFACYTYTDPGTYTVTLCVTDDEGATSCCTHEIEIEPAPNLPPVCGFAWSPQNPCRFETVQFTDESTAPELDDAVVAWEWDFGDGTGSMAENPTHQYAEYGAYSVCLTVTDSGRGGAYTPMASSCCQSVTVANLPPLCSFTGPTSGYVGEELCWASTSTDSNGTIVSYAWDFGDVEDYTHLIGNPSFENDTIDPWVQTMGRTQPQATPANGGDWTFCNYDARSGIRFFGDVSSWESVNSRIYQQISGVPIGLTFTASVWTNSISWHRVWPLPGNIHTRLGVDPTGGTDRDAATVVWNDEPSNMNCSPGPYVERTVRFTTTSSTVTLFCEIYGDSVVEWALGAMDDVSLVSSGAAEGVNVCHTYASEGTYTITLCVTDDEGATSCCADEIDIQLGPNLPPVCDFTWTPANPTDVQTVQFTDQSTPPEPDDAIVGWAWDFGDGGTSTDQNPTHLFANNGEYYVCLTATDNGHDGAYTPTSSSCCRHMAVSNVPPVCIIDGPTAGATGQQLCFSAGGSYDPDGGVLTYWWHMGDGPPEVPLLNPGFEEGSAGWTLAKMFVFDHGELGAPARSGAKMAGSVSMWGGISGTAIQDVSGLQPGETYPLCGWTYQTVSPGCGDQWGRVAVDLDCDGTFDIFSDPINADPVYPNPTAYQHACVEFTAVGSCARIMLENWSIGGGCEWRYGLWDDVTLGEGATTGISESQCVTYTEPGTYTVTLSVTDDDGATSTCTTTVAIELPADLQVTKSGPSNACPGGPISYDIHYRNNGPAWAHEVIVEDVPDPNVWSLLPTSWYLGDLAPGEEGHLYNEGQVAYPLDDGTILTNTVNISGDVCDSDLSNNSAQFDTTVNAAIDPNCKLVAPEGIVSPGQTLTYTVHYENVGEGDAYFVYLTDTLVPLLDETTLLINDGGTYDPETRTVTWEIGTVPAHSGGSVSMQVSVRADAPAGAAIGNMATVHFPTVPSDTNTNIVVNHVINQPPLADITFLPEVPTVLDVVTFTADATDPDGFVASVVWDFDDGSTAAGEAVTHQFSDDGAYRVWCAVTDDLGVSASYAAIVMVANLPPTCDPTYEPAIPTTEDTIVFHSGGHDPDDPVVSADWDFGDGGSASGDPTAHQYAATGTYTVTVTVTDDDGLAATCSRAVSVSPHVCLALTGNCWHLITMPCQPVEQDPWEVFNELRPPDSPIDLLTGNLHRYDHTQQKYVTYYHWAPTEFGSVQPGQGYWLWLFEDMSICYACQCAGASQTLSFSDPGWYLVGSPQPGDTHVESTLWRQGSTGPKGFSEIMNVWVMDPLIGYSCELGRYTYTGLLGTDEDDHLRAFQGYWLYTFVDDVTMEIPAPYPSRNMPGTT